MRPSPAHPPAAPKAGLPAREAEPGSRPGGAQRGERTILPARWLPLFRPLGRGSAPPPGARSRELLRGARGRGWSGSGPPAPGHSLAPCLPGLPAARARPREGRPSSRDRGTRAAGPARGEPGAGAADGAADRMSVCPRAERPFVPAALFPSEGTAAGPGTETAPPFVCW